MEEVEVLETGTRTLVVVRGDKGLSVYDMDSGEQIGDIIAEPQGESDAEWLEVTMLEGNPVAVTGSALGEVQVWSLQE